MLVTLSSSVTYSHHDTPCTRIASIVGIIGLEHTQGKKGGKLPDIRGPDPFDSSPPHAFISFNLVLPPTLVCSFLANKVPGADENDGKGSPQS